MYISYSGFKKYRDCPRAYYYVYIDKPILPEPEDRIGMLYGSVIGTLVEQFYQEKLWKSKTLIQDLQARAKMVLGSTMAKEGKSGVFNWDKQEIYKTPAILLEEIRASIPRVLKIIKHHGLMGTDAEAEVKLDSDIAGHRIGGRADTILTRYAHKDRIIYDGKGSKYRDQYVDVRQLHWYAMLAQEKFGWLPDQVAFVFWKFEPPEAVDWHPVAKENIAELKEEMLSVIGEISSKKRLPQAFEARPSASKCKLCPYVYLCPEGQMIRAKERPEFSEPVGVEDVTL